MMFEPVLPIGGDTPMKQAQLSALLLLSMLFSACKPVQDTDAQSTIWTEPSSAFTASSQTEANQFQPEAAEQEQRSEILSEESGSVKIQITVGDVTLIATPEKNSSAEAFLALLQEHPVAVQMSDYAGMEKVGPLGIDLPRNDAQISVGAGDVILYQGNQITIYYGTNSWSLTKLAVIEDATKESLLEILGTGDVEATFSLAQ